MSRISRLLILAVVGCGSGTDNGAPAVTTTLSSGGAGGVGGASTGGGGGHGGGGAGMGGTGGEGAGGEGAGGEGGGAPAPVVLDCAATTTPGGEEILAAGMTQPSGLVIRDGHAYFSQRGDEASVPGAVFRRSLSEGPCETLHSSPEPLTVAPTGVDDTHVYWASQHAIWRMPRAGGQAEVLVDGLDPTPFFVLDGLDAYFSSYTGGNLHRVAKTGGTVTILAQYQANPRLPTVDDTWLYWPNQGGNIQGGASFQRVLKTGGPVEIFLPNRTIARRVDLMNGEIFVADSEGLLRLPTAASPPELIATDVGFYLALDSTYAYFSQCVLGRILRVPLAGGPTVTIATNQVCPTEIVSEAGHLYWLNRSSGQLVRKAK